MRKKKVRKNPKNGHPLSFKYKSWENTTTLPLNKSNAIGLLSTRQTLQRSFSANVTSLRKFPFLTTHD